MDKDVIRREVAEELQAQYDSRLREVKKQKSQAEEELESAAERWRGERRKLNAEIDRLESALSTARDSSSRRVPPAAGPPAVDPLELAKIREASEERLRKASSEWETERARLCSQIARLERAVAEAIERSSNSIRSTQPIKEQFEAQLEDAAKSRLELEQDFLRAKGTWDEERKKLAGEIIKLRRLAPPSKALEAKEKLEQLRGRKESLEELRIKELEDHLSKAREEVQQYHQVSMQARETAKAEFEPRFEQLRHELDAAHTEIQQLRRALTESHDRVSAEVVDQLRIQYNSKMQEISHQKTQMAQELQAATAMLQTERSRFSREASHGADHAAIQAEVERVGRIIEAIAALMEDPATDLSTVIRKNVEKAELDAYLKGILFSQAHR